jgi:ABC-type microcin C transport system permease subunit YejB
LIKKQFFSSKIVKFSSKIAKIKLRKLGLIKFQEEKKEETGKGKKAKKAAKKKNKMMNEKFDGEAVGRITQEVEFEKKCHNRFQSFKFSSKFANSSSLYRNNFV